MFISSIKKYFKFSSCIGILAISFLETPAYAQVIKDGSLPTNVQTTDNLNFTIDSINNKNRMGNNLFHSFKEFSIPTGGSAVFSNSPDVVNIINRVTGGSISNIDGLIKANGNANLFLINPAGIVFGKNARLDIGGSFFGSTAQSIKFADGEFSAIDTTTKPLLSINVPLGLQMGSNSAAIEVQGEGYTAASNDGNLFIPLVINNVNGLRVKQGNTLALVGSEISLNGGIVAADSGRIELGGVKEGLVDINLTMQNWGLDYGDLQNFGNIKFNSSALADASGTESGSIHLQGRNISIREGSKAFIQSQGLESGGKIEVNATKLIEVVGVNSSNINYSISGLFTETINTGNAAQIEISSADLRVSQGAGIMTRTFNTGQGGDIKVNAFKSLEITESSSVNPLNSSGIMTQSYGKGAAGDIRVSTEELLMIDRFISSTIYGIGNGGDISVLAQKLTLLDGAAISSVTSQLGKGGDVKINAQSIELTGLNLQTFTPSTLTAATIGSANAGNLIINTGSLIVQDGGRVDSSTLASGNSGSVTINATNFVEVRGTVPGSINPSLIISSANIVDESFQQFLGISGTPSGDSGNVIINTPVLRVNNGAEVTVKNDGIGEGGILNINAGSILVKDKGKITASTQSGEGGNIDLQVKDSLTLRNQSFISAEAGGSGDGGNISINSPVIAGVENSDIIANALQGNGGNIKINTQGLFGLQFRDELTKENDITASSRFGVNGTVEINNPAIDPSSALVELSTELTDPSQKIATGCSVNSDSTFVATGRGGIPHNPSHNLNIDRNWSDIRDLSAYRQGMSDSEIIRMENKPAIVEATGFIRNQNGEIELVALSPNSFTTKQLSECSGANT